MNADDGWTSWPRRADGVSNGVAARWGRAETFSEQEPAHGKTRYHHVTWGSGDSSVVRAPDS